jgi:signal transduction histidine kinase
VRTAAEPPLGRAVAIHATVTGGVVLGLIVIWALTSRGYFWPMWPALVLALPLAMHAWCAWVNRQPAGWFLERRISRGFAIHAGLWAAYLLFATGIWAASGGGYFWPVWPALAAIIAVGSHGAAVRARTPDRTALTERITALETSRAGAVDVQESELRRIERDLHDGAQAQMVAVAMKLGLAREKLGSAVAGAAQPDLGRILELVDTAHRGAKEAIAELRNLARGIHPPVLDEGLGTALTSLAAGSDLPIQLVMELPERPSAAIETIAYFCAAELLTNAAKHSGARQATLEAIHEQGLLRVRVSDDGCGGARMEARGGLAGLADRIRAVDGKLHVNSPTGGPTVIAVELPSHA